MCQLHLQAAFFGFGTLGEDIQNQTAAIHDHDAQHLLQRTLLGRGKVVVADDQIGFGGLQQLFDLFYLAFTEETVGIGSGAVLQHLGSTLTACSFQQGFQLVQRLLGGILLPGENACVEANQNRFFNDFFLKRIHNFSKIFQKIEKSPHQFGAGAGDYFRPYFLLKRSTRPPVSTSFCLPV